MNDFLASTLFRYLIFPVGSAILGIIIKYVTRNDQYAKFRKEDIAIGLDLLLTAAMMFVLLTTDRALSLIRATKLLANVLHSSPVDANQATILQTQIQDLSCEVGSAGWLVLLLLISLWSVSTVVRKWGWKSETEMYPMIGITLPLSIGILALVAVMAGASK